MKQRGTLRWTGHDKNADLVYLETKHGFIVRKAPAKGSHADDKNLKQNSGSAGPINRLAGELARTIQYYARGCAARGLYHTIKSRFFGMQYPHRLIWLSSLEGMDAHDQKTLAEAIEQPVIAVTPEAGGIKIKATITHHANFDKYHKFYSLNIILVFWNSGDDKINHSGKYTAWLDRSKEPPFNYTFEFERPANMTDYLVLCCCLRAEGKDEEMYPPDGALKVMAVGSFDEKALAELAAYREAKNIEIKPDNKDRIRRDDSQVQEPDEE